MELSPLDTSQTRFERRFRMAVALSLAAHAVVLAAMLMVVLPRPDRPPEVAVDLVLEQPPPPPPPPPAPAPVQAAPPPQQPQIATQLPAPPPDPAAQNRPQPAPPPQAKPQGNTAARTSMPAVTIRPEDFRRAGSNWLPVYPESARANKLQGQVVITVDIDTAGWPTRVVVSHSSGHAQLDEAARLAVRYWKFRPPQYNGKPVTATVDIPFDFKL